MMLHEYISNADVQYKRTVKKYLKHQKTAGSNCGMFQD